MPIIALSASVPENEEIELEKLDIQDDILKAYRESEFYSTVGKELDNQFRLGLPVTDYGNHSSRRGPIGSSDLRFSFNH